MSATFRPKRTLPSAVNSPIVSHVLKSSCVAKSEAERILSAFIDASDIDEIGKTTSQVDSGFKNGLSGNSSNGPVVMQLKRIQRELRGLPPLLVELNQSGQKSSFESGTENNRKIKFDDDDESDLNLPSRKKIKFSESETVPYQIDTSNTSSQIVGDIDQHIPERTNEEKKDSSNVLDNENINVKNEGEPKDLRKEKESKKTKKEKKDKKEKEKKERKDKKEKKRAAKE